MTYAVTILDKPANLKRTFQPVSLAAVDTLKEILTVLGFEINITELETDVTGNPILTK